MLFVKSNQRHASHFTALLVQQLFIKWEDLSNQRKAHPGKSSKIFLPSFGKLYDFKNVLKHQSKKSRVANFNRPAGFFINFGRPKLAEIKNVQKIRVFRSYLDGLRDNSVIMTQNKVIITHNDLFWWFLKLKVLVGLNWLKLVASRKYMFFPIYRLF